MTGLLDTNVALYLLGGRLAGDLKVERQSGNRLRVTFPLRFDLRNGAKHSSGKIDKTLILEATGDDWQIVAVNERKAK